MSPNHHDRHWWFHPAVPTGGQLPFGDRAADTVTSALGGWKFIWGMTLVVGVWLMWNSLTPPEWQFDPKALNFTLLTLILSLQASYASPLILMSQNRRSAVDAQLADNDRQIMAQLVRINETQTQLLEAVHAHLGIGASDAPR